MRIIQNERRINLFSSIGQYATLGGFLALLISLVSLLISFTRPTWTMPTLVGMFVGLLLSTVGGAVSDRYVGPLAHHKALIEVLKGLDYRHTLIQYLLPASHVLLEPGGCTVFVVKTQEGHVVYENGEDGKWRHHQRWKFFHKLAGRERLGTPHVEAEQEVCRLKRYLDERMPDADEVPVRPAIVFVNPDVELEADDSPVPAIYRKKVKNWLRGPGRLDPLPDDVHRRLTEALGVDEAEST